MRPVREDIPQLPCSVHSLQAQTFLGREAQPALSDWQRSRQTSQECKCHDFQRLIDPLSEEYFQTEDKSGDGVNPLHGFEALIEAYFNTSYTKANEFPVYKYLTKFSEICGIALEDQSQI